VLSSRKNDSTVSDEADPLVKALQQHAKVLQPRRTREHGTRSCNSAVRLIDVSTVNQVHLGTTRVKRKTVCVGTDHPEAYSWQCGIVTALQPVRQVEPKPPRKVTFSTF
jgi:hypothetical protein